MAAERDIESRKELDEMTVDELEQLLREDFYCSDRIEGPVYEELEQLREALEKKRPVEYLYTADESWTRFTEDHAEELARICAPETPIREVSPDAVRPCRRGRAVLRYALVAVLVLVFLVGATLTASAMGVDLWAWVPRQSSGKLHFEPVQPKATMTHELREALETLDTMEKVLPNWIPEGLSLVESKFDPKQGFINRYFEGEDRHLSISVLSIEYLDHSFFNTDDEPPLEYMAGNTVHYIARNSKNIMALWYTEHYFTVVSGNITLEEMKHIIDSVYANP